MPKDVKHKKKVIHPNSRAALHLARKSFHEQRVERRYKEKATKLEVLGDKLKWFQEHIDPDKLSYTKQEACELVEEYLSRFDEELEQIEMRNNMKGRSGFQHISRQQVIKITLEKECNQYENSGFEIPDITSAKNFKVFREWTGELRYIQNIKMIKVVKSDREMSRKKDKKNMKMQQEKDISVLLDEDTPMAETKEND